MARSFYGRVGISSNVAEGFDKLLLALDQAEINAVLAAAEPIRQRAHDLANVSKGEIGHAKDGRHMRDCIDLTLVHRPNGVDCRIGIDLGNVPYAAHQEFGANGKPFLRPAIEEGRAQAHQTMVEALKSSLFEGLDIKTAVRFRAIA